MSFLTRITSGISSLLPQSGISSLLPQNEHTANVSRIEAKITKLKLALGDHSSGVFTAKIEKKIAKLETEKKVCEERLAELNGSYYQDPASLLKKAWDSIVDTIDTTFNVRIKTREELDSAPERIFENLNAITDRDKFNTKSVVYSNTTIAITDYIKLEEERDAIQAQIKKIVVTQKTEPKFEKTLSDQLKALEARQKELCGEYYQDPRGLLDQKWRASQAGNSDASAEFFTLETERKSNEAKIFALREQISAGVISGRDIEAVTAESIDKKVVELEKKKLEESALSGVDWTKTVVSTAKVAGIAALGISAANVGL